MQVLQDDSGNTTAVGYLVKFSITLGLLILITRKIDPQAAIQSLKMLAPVNIMLALALQTASSSVASYRWSLIMDRIGFRQPFSFYLKSYFKGTFFNQGLPTSIGGDGVKIIDCSRCGRSAIDGFYGVFIDRIVGLAGLVVLNMAALLLNRSLLPANIHYLLLGILTSFLAGFIALFYLRKISFFTGNGRLGILGRLSEQFCRLYSDGWSFFFQVGLSILIHLMAMTTFYVLGTGLGLTYSLPVYLVLVPPVILLTILPLSLAGWGIREGAMVGFFLLIGAPRSPALSLSVLYGLTVIASSLPGLYVYLRQKNKI